MTVNHLCTFGSYLVDLWVTICLPGLILVRRRVWKVIGRFPHSISNTHNATTQTALGQISAVYYDFIKAYGDCLPLESVRLCQSTRWYYIRLCKGRLDYISLCPIQVVVSARFHSWYDLDPLISHYRRTSPRRVLIPCRQRG